MYNSMHIMQMYAEVKALPPSAKKTGTCRIARSNGKTTGYTDAETIRT